MPESALDNTAMFVPLSDQFDGLSPNPVAVPLQVQATFDNGTQLPPVGWNISHISKFIKLEVPITWEYDNKIRGESEIVFVLYAYGYSLSNTVPTVCFLCGTTVPSMFVVVIMFCSEVINCTHSVV